MKKVLLVLFVLVVAVSLSTAGTPNESQGSKALSFVINGLGNFGITSASANSFAGFGGKYYISNDMELRGVLGFNMNTVQHKDGAGVDNGKDATTTFGIAPAILWHMSAAGAVSPYWGFQGEFATSKLTHTPQPTGTESSGTGTEIGLAGVLGAEWYAWDGISFNAEYQLGFNNETTKSDAGGTSVDGPSVTNFGISSWAVGINVYLGQ